jgi:hypothetical protein
MKLRCRTWSLHGPCPWPINPPLKWQRRVIGLWKFPVDDEPVDLSGPVHFNPSLVDYQIFTLLRVLPRSTRVAVDEWHYLCNIFRSRLTERILVDSEVAEEKPSNLYPSTPPQPQSVIRIFSSRVWSVGVRVRDRIMIKFVTLSFAFLFLHCDHHNGHARIDILGHPGQQCRPEPFAPCPLQTFSWTCESH